MKQLELSGSAGRKINIELAKSFVQFFPLDGSGKHVVVFNFIQNNDNVTAVVSAAFKKRLIKIGEFLCSHFNIKDGRKKQHFWHIMLYYFKKCKHATEMQRKKFVQCVEKVLRLIKHVKSGLRSFMLEISRWTMLHSQVDQLTLIVIKSRH